MSGIIPNDKDWLGKNGQDILQGNKDHVFACIGGFSALYKIHIVILIISLFQRFCEKLQEGILHVRCEEKS
jgi:hypothetical protein